MINFENMKHDHLAQYCAALEKLLLESGVHFRCHECYELAHVDDKQVAYHAGEKVELCASCVHEYRTCTICEQVHHDDDMFECSCMKTLYYCSSCEHDNECKYCYEG